MTEAAISDISRRLAELFTRSHKLSEEMKATQKCIKELSDQLIGMLAQHNVEFVNIDQYNRLTVTSKDAAPPVDKELLKLVKQYLPQEQYVAIENEARTKSETQTRKRRKIVLEKLTWKTV